MRDIQRQYSFYKMENLRSKILRLVAYSVGTWYWGYLLFRNSASSTTLVLTAQHIYLPEADSFSAKNIWALQTSSTCVIEIEPDSICIPFKAFFRNSFPAICWKTHKRANYLLIWTDRKHKQNNTYFTF